MIRRPLVWQGRCIGFYVRGGGNAALEGEADARLSSVIRSSGNRRDSKMPEQVLYEYGKGFL